MVYEKCKGMMINNDGFWVHPERLEDTDVPSRGWMDRGLEMIDDQLDEEELVDMDLDTPHQEIVLQDRAGIG